jgi:hypothetical protein
MSTVVLYNKLIDQVVMIVATSRPQWTIEQVLRNRNPHIFEAYERKQSD